MPIAIGDDVDDAISKQESEHFSSLLVRRHRVTWSDSDRSKDKLRDESLVNINCAMRLPKLDFGVIRMDASDMIRNAGFCVVEAANADEAVAVLETGPDITVVFNDIQMPGSMDGLKLAAAIRHRWPAIKIIATSGIVKVGLGDLPESGHFLQKPDTRAQIITAITSSAA
jgi:CheY-like chemotaxis protein